MARLKFINALVFVADMERAIGFYRDLLDQKIAQHHGDFVQLENGLALHLGRALETTMFGAPSADGEPYGRGNLALYFEVEDIAAAFARIAPAVGLIHPVQTQAWGQKVFRFYDPDGHIVEVGDPL